jgi:hypothetical protein
MIYSSYSLLISTLDGGEWSASCLGRALPPGKDPRCPLYRGWVGPRAGLDTEARGEIRCFYPGSNPDRPVFQFVVRQYPGSLLEIRGRHLLSSRRHTLISALKTFGDHSAFWHVLGNSTYKLIPVRQQCEQICTASTTVYCVLNCLC